MFVMCYGLFGAIAVPALSGFQADERVPFQENAFALVMIPLLVVIFGVFAMGMSLLGEKFKSIAHDHSRLLSLKSLSATNTSARDPSWESAITSAKDVIQTTQQLEPMSILGIVELDGCEALF